MSLIKKLAALGAAAEAARRYARSNPDKARELTEKAARFADHQTKGRYSQQIQQAKNALANAGGFASPPGAAANPLGTNPPPVSGQAEVVSPPSPGPRPTPYKRG
jgi:hypothetical protein